MMFKGYISESEAQYLNDKDGFSKKFKDSLSIYHEMVSDKSEVPPAPAPDPAPTPAPAEPPAEEPKKEESAGESA